MSLLSAPFITERRISSRCLFRDGMNSLITTHKHCSNMPLSRLHLDSILHHCPSSLASMLRRRSSMSFSFYNIRTCDISATVRAAGFDIIRERSSQSWSSRHYAHILSYGVTDFALHRPLSHTSLFELSTWHHFRRLNQMGITSLIFLRVPVDVLPVKSRVGLIKVNSEEHFIDRGKERGGGMKERAEEKEKGRN